MASHYDTHKGNPHMKHPGFARVAEAAAERQHIPVGQADAEIAAATRNASKHAHNANPHLNRVPGGNNTGKK